MSRKNIDLIFIFIFFAVLIWFMPTIVDLLTKEEDIVDEPNIVVSTTEANRLLRVIGSSYHFLDNSTTITDEDILNEIYETDEESVKNVVSIKEFEDAYIVVLNIFFKDGNNYYQDKDHTVLKGSLEGRDFSDALFTNETDLWEYKYRIHKITHSIMAFKVVKK